MATEAAVLTVADVLFVKNLYFSRAESGQGFDTVSDAIVLLLSMVSLYHLMKFPGSGLVVKAFA